MAEYKHPSLPVKFSLPDKLTVRDQLAYYSAVGDAFGEPTWIRYWRGASELVRDWECELIPNIKELDIDAETNPDIATIAIWVGKQVVGILTEMESVPKNE